MSKPLFVDLMDLGFLTKTKKDNSIKVMLK